jgi:hypothetical protein
VIRGRWQGFRAGDAALGKAVCFGFAAVFVSPIRIKRVPNRLDDLRYDIALASRMLAHENVLDAFGHVSMRHPTDRR